MIRFALTALLLFLTASTTGAQVVGKPGDILVTNGNGSIILVDATTHAQSIVLVGQALPSGIATNDMGDAVFIDCGGTPSSVNGRFTKITSMGNWLDFTLLEQGFYGCTLDDAGNAAFVRTSVFARYSAGTGQVDRVLIPQGLGDPRHIVQYSDGDYIFVDRFSYFTVPVGHGAVLRFSPATSQVTPVSLWGLLEDPTGIAVDAGGQLIVADENGPDPGRILGIDPASGAQTLLYSGGYLVNPSSIAVAGDGAYIISDSPAPLTGRLIRIDPASGNQSILSEGGLLVEPRGIVLVKGELPVPVTGTSWGRLKDRYRK